MQLDHQTQHAKEMRDASAQHEQMPDRVMIRQFPEQIEQHPQCVARPANQHPGEKGAVHCFAQGIDGNQNHPAHEDVNEDGKPFQLAQGEDLEIDAQNGQAPDHSKQRPTPAAPDGTNCDRGVSAGDEQENVGVIKDPEKAFELWIAEGVIECRAEVHGNQGSAIDTERHHLPYIAAFGGEYHQNHQRGNTEPNSCPVGDAVGDFLPQALPGTEGNPVQETDFIFGRLFLQFALLCQQRTVKLDDSLFQAFGHQAGDRFSRRDA